MPRSCMTVKEMQSERDQSLSGRGGVDFHSIRKQFGRGGNYLHVCVRFEEPVEVDEHPSLCAIRHGICNFNKHPLSCNDAARFRAVRSRDGMRRILAVQ